MAFHLLELAEAEAQRRTNRAMANILRLWGEEGEKEGSFPDMTVATLLSISKGES